MPRRRLARLLLSLCCLWPAPPSGAGAAPALPGQRIDPPRILKRVEPIYPEAARRAGIRGVVTVEATIGPDGKVRDARILQSIPQLDEAALAAVRQWEYAPTIVGGVATPVVMTVKVSFSLDAPAASVRTGGPLVLHRDAEDWTLNGTPLLDDNLRLRLAEVMRNEADKQLFVRLLDGTTYAQLIDTLASAVAAGVERLYVFAGADTAQAVRVSLEAVPAAQTRVSLPAADVVAAATKPTTAISLPRAGTTANAKAALQRAGKDAEVRLHIDAARPVSDVWDVLRLGPALGIVHFSLAVQQPGAPYAALGAGGFASEPAGVGRDLADRREARAG